jgi:hypothetical protein
LHLPPPVSGLRMQRPSHLEDDYPQAHTAHTGGKGIQSQIAQCQALGRGKT